VKNVEHPWVSMDIYLVDFTGKIYSGIIVTYKKVWLCTHIKVWCSMLVKVFAPPKEHGPAHVHVIAKGEKAEVKISLVTLEVIGSTQFSIRAVKGIIKYIHENYEYLWKCWEALHGKKEKTKSKASSKKSR
jgi:hypothetical protein